MKILVAPLDWGLGHATRCVPLIDLLLQKGHEVVLAGDGASLHLLRDHFPGLPAFELPAYNIRYAPAGSQVAQILKQTPRLFRTIREEHAVSGRLVREQKIEAILSDNRYGLWSKGLPSVFMTHQPAVMVKDYAGLFRKMTYRLQLRFIRSFSHIWIPDYPGPENLSGGLSHDFPLPGNARFIGPLSRFSGLSDDGKPFSVPELNARPPDMVAILSGPEPQRGLFEEKLLQMAASLDRTLILVQGKPGNPVVHFHQNLCVINSLPSLDLYRLLVRARLVISRPGYSSLMDYATIGRGQLLLVPTPGQVEQEYLGERIELKGLAYSVSQNSLHLETDIQKAVAYAGFPPTAGNERKLLESAVDAVFGIKPP